MALLTQTASGASAGSQGAKKKPSFAEQQRLAKMKAYEKQAKSKKIKMQDLTVFTQQLSSMLEAGLALVSALEAMQDQTENPVFQVIIRNVKNDVASGTSFSEAVAKYPRAFPNLFISMVEAGEASGGLAEILSKTAVYFEDSVKLMRKVKGAMTYPIAVIGLAILLVGVLLTTAVPEFAGMFSEFGAQLPTPTQVLIQVSEFVQAYWFWMIIGAVVLFKGVDMFTQTPRGRRIKDIVISRLPIVGELSRKINLSRFCRTYAILMRAGVPILRTLEITSRASNNTYIEQICLELQRHVSAGGQFSEVLAANPYFPSMVKHMARAGEQTGDVDGMLNKVADFYDDEIDNTVASLTSLMEPFIIVVLGTIIGTIVAAMFMPIFQLANVVGN